MSIFGNLDNSTDLETQTESVGTGSRYFESGAYEAVIQMAYADQSKGGALNVNFVFKTQDGKELKETIYVSSGKAKGQKNYYEREGKKYPLPGFSIVNAISLMASGKELSQQETEQKLVPIYNYDLKKEVPTEKPVLMDLLGKKVILGVHKVIENKRVKSDSGEYVPINEERTYNTINKVFHPETKQTVTEALAKQDATMYDKWVEANTGKDQNKYKEVPDTVSTSSSSSTDSPFPF